MRDNYWYINNGQYLIAGADPVFTLYLPSGSSNSPIMVGDDNEVSVTDGMSFSLASESYCEVGLVLESISFSYIDYYNV